MRKKLFILFNYIVISTVLYAAEIETAIVGTLNWATMYLDTEISLNLAKAGIKMPGGRAQAEEVLLSEYLRLVRPVLLSLPVDSSSLLIDLVRKGELSTSLVDQMAMRAARIPPSLSPDFSRLSASRKIDLKNIAPALMNHKTAAEIPETFFPLPAPDASGIIILAYNELPVHGRNTSAYVLPCLFPKIWNTKMDLIYEREMTSLENKTGEAQGNAQFAMVRYTGADSIFSLNPSGISEDLEKTVGKNPLRIFAEEVFGKRPTDIVISDEDALLIISNPVNRELLRQGKVAFVVSDDVLITGMNK